ncbi:hypothetical protein L7F22_053852 [Adiantum nelumboides]|nr:hypothetical protein [Adiantum nelumboides]
MVQVGTELMEAEPACEWDIDGNKHFILESSLSRVYVIQHIGTVQYISDTENSVSIEFSQGIVKTKVKLTDKDEKLDELNFIISDNDVQQVSTAIKILTDVKSSKLQNMMQACNCISKVKEILKHTMAI